MGRAYEESATRGILANDRQLQAGRWNPVGVSIMQSVASDGLPEQADKADPRVGAASDVAFLNPVARCTEDRAIPHLVTTQHRSGLMRMPRLADAGVNSSCL